MTDVSAFRQQLRARMKELDLSITRLAAMSGVHKATIHRLLDEKYEFTPSLRTISRLSEALEVEGFAIDKYGRGYEAPTIYKDDARVEITALCSAGLWLTDAQRAALRFEDSPLSSLHDLPSEYETAVKIAGNWAEPAFLDGDILRIALFGATRAFASEGDFLFVVARTEAGLTEMSIRRVLEVREKTFLLAYPSNAPEWSGEVEALIDFHSSNEPTLIAPMGLVAGIYRPVPLRVASMFR